MFLGGFLALFGAMADESGLTTGGLITAGVGAVLIAPGVYLIVTSGAGTEVHSDRGQLARRSESLPPPRQLGVRLEL